MTLEAAFDAGRLIKEAKTLKRKALMEQDQIEVSMVRDQILGFFGQEPVRIVEHCSWGKGLNKSEISNQLKFGKFWGYNQNLVMGNQRCSFENEGCV